ncbi:MAG: ArsR/SmtB family transcription factor [Polyangiales bacterium]
MASPTLTAAGFREVATFFRALSDPIRLRIVHLLRAQPRSVGEVVEALDIPQPSASRHLARLHAAGLIARSRQGNQIIYAVRDAFVGQLCDLACGRLAANDAARPRWFGAE